MLFTYKRKKKEETTEFVYICINIYTAPKYNYTQVIYNNIYIYIYIMLATLAKKKEHIKMLFELCWVQLYGRRIFSYL